LVEFSQDLYDELADYLELGQDLYKDLLHAGVAKECARRVLPMCQNTRMYMTGSIRSWLHYCDVRCGPETQLEHREIAEQVKMIIKEMLPNVYEAMWPTWVAPPVHFTIAPPLSLWGRVKEALGVFFDG
jgi:thymidylate synthase (FAD)